MKFTKEQAELNGKAVSAFLQGKPIQLLSESTGDWLDVIATPSTRFSEGFFRPKAAPAPPARWSRMEHVPLPCWVKCGSSDVINSLTRIDPRGIYFNEDWHSWNELDGYFYTTGECDASGSFIFRECLVLP
jgi:hypothetical protein